MTNGDVFLVVRMLCTSTMLVLHGACAGVSIAFGLTCTAGTVLSSSAGVNQDGGGELVIK